MRPTDTSDPRYYHRVVDCQWACPAHTNIPQYIRLIAQGRFTESYLLNRRSNVFPGILGRTCDRPCEPACRRGRVDGKPVAICRLKRVAADLRDDIRDKLPHIPKRKNGKRIAVIGAGPAGLTVANDLMPFGYEVVMFEKLPRAGGLMRVNIPSFRLPAQVLDDEVNMILDMGVDIRYSTPVESMRKLLADSFDAVFVGSGAPRGKNLDVPGRYDTPDKVHIGIDWLESVHFGHVTSIGKRVLIIGVGNTAMDCCRTSKRLGASDVKVIGRKPRKYFKASPWELEDAEEETVEILENYSPVRFVHQDGVLVGMEFERFKSEEINGKLRQTLTDKIILPCDEVILAIGQENSFPWIERDIGLDFKDEMPVVDELTHQSSRDGVFFGGDAAWGPQNIIWAVEHGHQAAISIDSFCHKIDVKQRPPQGMNLIGTKMGLHEWSYSNDYSGAKRAKMEHVELKQRLSSLNLEVELGFSAEQTVAEVERCLNCDVQTEFTADKCIECDACIDVCPMDCLTITKPSVEPELRGRLTAPALNLKQPLYASVALKQTGRIMVKDEDVCLHCGLCAERCPTSAWDMQRFVLQYPHAGEHHQAKPSPAAADSEVAKALVG
jgi:NADPH-dependent glutamate synthase beta subunit-like oxidoreductase/NAD-dependent dihydropyrimidine dehydrogenase PreA subunit